VVPRRGYSPTVSVVVCTRDRPQQLDRCLASLASLSYPAYHVLVVDNAPRDERSREVALYWGVQYLIEPVRGVTRARNRGAYACRTEIIAYVDDDAMADPSWLEVLTQDFADPRVAAVTGAILPINPASRNDTIGRGAERGPRRVVGRETPGWFEIANFGDLGDESNMAFRRGVFDVWPGFDERLGRGALLDGGEGHYAFFELIERGYRIVYNPEAIVRHPCARTLEEMRSRHLSLLATTTAYITRLAMENPSCRRALAQYILDRLRGASRPWTNCSEKIGARIAPRWLSLLAMLSGPWIYLRSRMAAKQRAGNYETEAESFEASHVRRAALRHKTLRLES
jgi:glycosyltransferase involved in cell wall biosynthesis